MESSAGPIGSTVEHQDRLRLVIQLLESQRAILGDAAVNAGLEPIRAALATLATSPSFQHEELVPRLKQVTVLFANVVGSTALSRRLDPEAIRSVIDSLLERFTTIIAGQGGRVMRYMGDGLLAVFGADRSREDDAQRAVDAALDLVAEATRIAHATPELAGAAYFGIRAGLHTGSVYLGDGVEGEKAVHGVAVNLAARMEQTAQPGTVRISQSTYRHVTGHFDLDEQPPIQVKGYDEPVTTYVVRKTRAPQSWVGSAGIGGLNVPLIGRNAEIAWLREALSSVLEQRRLRCVSIMGDAGVGKSRVAQELLTLVESQHSDVAAIHTWLTPIGQHRASPYRLLKNIVLTVLGVDDSRADDYAGLDMSIRLAEACQNLVDTSDIELVCHILGIGSAKLTQPGWHSASQEGVRNVASDAAVQQRVLRLFGHLLWQTCTARRPLRLIILDDLQRSDDESIAIIEQAIRHYADLPLLLVCVARGNTQDEESKWQSIRQVSDVLTLAVLNREQSIVLSKALLQRMSDPPALLMDALVRRAEGNPFYMEEVVKMFLDTGVILDDGSGWQASIDALATTPVPSTITGVLQARLDTLPGDMRLALQKAAVVGYRFWDAALTTLGCNLSDYADQLTAHGMIRRNASSTLPSVSEFEFSSAMLHQVAYDCTLRSVRKVLHSRMADWLTTATDGISSDWIALIGAHHERAGELGPARAASITL